MTFIEIILLLIIIGLLINRNGDILDVLGRRKKIILDSCGLIDGRILEIAQSGFIIGELILPQFILAELQLLADGQDAHKRERARFGLDVANKLQETQVIRITINHHNLNMFTTTDDKLVALAKKFKGVLYTTDFNLQKVANLEGVKVLNVNELAQNLRPMSLPGESIKVRILQKGNAIGQGIGYMDDGTMIVVDGAGKALGKDIEATVLRMHQTVAGKMIFAEYKPATELKAPNRSRHERKDRLPIIRSIRQRMRSHKVQ